MRLKSYILLMPASKRSKAYKDLAMLHGKAVSTIYKWAQNDSHPADEASVSITEKWSNSQVNRFDLAPSVWRRESLAKITELALEVENDD